MHQRSFSRSDRIADLIREEVALIFLNEVSDKRLKNINITDVRISPDLSVARIYYVTPNKKEDAVTKKTLDSVKGFVRKELSKKLELRRVPSLEFHYDLVFETGMGIEKLLKGAGNE